MTPNALFLHYPIENKEVLQSLQSPLTQQFARNRKLVTTTSNEVLTSSGPSTKLEL